MSWLWTRLQSSILCDDLEGKFVSGHAQSQLSCFGVVTDKIKQSRSLWWVIFFVLLPNLSDWDLSATEAVAPRDTQYASNSSDRWSNWNIDIEMRVCVYVCAQSVNVTTEGQCRQYVMPQDSACAVGVSEVLDVTTANQDTTPSPTVKVKILLLN